MKKIIIAIISIVLVVGLCSCSAKNQAKIMDSSTVDSYMLEKEDLQDESLKTFINGVEATADNKLGSSVSASAGYYEADDAIYLVYKYDIEKTYLKSAIEENSSLWTEVVDLISNEYDSVASQAKENNIHKNIGVFVTDKNDEPLLFIYNGETITNKF